MLTRIFILIVSSLLFSGCSSNKAISVHNYEQAGNYKEIIKLYKEKLSKDTGNNDVLLSLSDAYSKSSDFSNAKFYINKVDVNKISERGLYYKIKGDVSLGLNEQHDAIEYYLKAKKNNNDSSDLENGLGIAYANTGDFENSNTSFDEARILNGNESKLQNNIAVNLMSQKKYKEAVDLLLPIYSQNKNLAQVKYNLGFSLLMLDAVDAASEVLKPDFDKDEVIELSKRINPLKGND